MSWLLVQGAPNRSPKGGWDGLQQQMHHASSISKILTLHQECTVSNAALTQHDDLKHNTHTHTPVIVENISLQFIISCIFAPKQLWPTNDEANRTFKAGFF